MKVFTGRSIPNLYTEILDYILNNGREVGPRGMKTKEVGPIAIEALNPRERLFGHPHRKEVPIFTYIEGLWMLLGEDTPDRIGHYVKGMLPFVNSKTGKFDGAYGPRLRHQISFSSGKRIDQFVRIYELLKKDPDSRRAICSIHLSELDWTENSLDVPCTLTFQFLLRNHKLNMLTMMRSQDAYLGLIYDTGEFQWFQEIIAGWLGVDVGTYTHVVGSEHLYEKDWDKAFEVIKEDRGFNLYNYVSPLDCRLSKEEFDITLHNLDLIETVYRTNNLSLLNRGITFKNGFYANLNNIIRLYNLRLQGYKDFTAGAIETCRHTDLGYIYWKRWNPDG